MLSSCGGATTVAPTQSPTPSPTPSASPSASLAPAGSGAITFTVDAASKATVRVREQLARVPAPSDAVLTIGGATGTFTLNSDGTFASGSKISVDMNTIASDDRQRDDTIKRDPLEVRAFPRAEFVPRAIGGLALPVATSGDLSFTLAGDMTIHGTTKAVTFDVKATRTGTKLTATATANPTWKFADFGMRPPSSFLVLSIVDEIKLEFALVASEVRPSTPP
ncbi:MAG TPA: YceI family protein [Candidatus Limnocylindria bacterium]|nr:YceI family protein [Candidatus Limnocylindria bacterium]